MFFLFVVRSNACLGVDFIFFVSDIFVVSLGCLVLYQKHVRFGLIVVLLLALKLCLWVCMCAHTYVCIRILMPRNVDLGFLQFWLFCLVLIIYLSLSESSFHLFRSRVSIVWFRNMHLIGMMSIIWFMNMKIVTC